MAVSPPGRARRLCSLHLRREDWPLCSKAKKIVCEDCCLRLQKGDGYRGPCCANQPMDGPPFAPEGFMTRLSRTTSDSTTLLTPNTTLHIKLAGFEQVQYDSGCSWQLKEHKKK